jgi:signal recognition particle subunit SRP54
VQQLLTEHKRFAKMIGKMGKMGKGKGGLEQQMSQMQRNPQAMMKQMQSVMDPRMMQQMGGSENMMKMMKQMG